MGNVIYCEKCHEDYKDCEGIYLPGYMFPDEYRNTCKIHNTSVVDIGIPSEEGRIIADAIHDSKIFKEMVQLWKDGSDEYEIKLKQYSIETKLREQKEHEKWFLEEQKREEEEKRKHAVKCPYCGSTNVSKISGRLLSAYLFGLGSRMIGKEWSCDKCDSYF